MGLVFGVIFAFLPWPTAMKMLGAGTPALIEVFLRLVGASSAADRPFFDYVLAHELAIEKFAALEVQGGGASDDVINTLLVSKSY